MCYYIFNTVCQMLLTFWQIMSVSFWGIRVFRKKVLPFSGDGFGRGQNGWGLKACPKIGVSCFRKITFAIFGGWPRRGQNGGKMGRIMSQNRGFLFSEKRFCRKRDIKQPILLKNCKNGLKHVPKSGFLISRKKVLPKKGHAIKSRFSIFFKCTKTATRYMLTKMNPFSACQIWQNVIFLLSFCISIAPC